MFADIDSQDIVITLQQHVQQQQVLPSQIAFRWSQISIIFCRSRGRAKEDMLQFENDGVWGYLLKPNEHWRNCLLFVHYEAQFRRLFILGSLARQRVPELLELGGFLSIGDLSQEMVYSLDPLEQAYLEQMRQLKCHYTAFPDLSNPLQNFDGQLLYEELNSITGADALFYIHIKEMSAGALAQWVYNMILRPDAGLRYHAGLLLAATHSDLKREFINKELALLKLRFSQCYRSERQRFAYLSVVFPGLARAVEFTVPEQFISAPPGVIQQDAGLCAGYNKLLDYCRHFFPQDCAPGIGFIVPAQYCSTELLCRLDVRNGLLCIPHQELASVCANYLGERIEKHILDVSRRYRLLFARKYWTRLILRTTKSGLKSTLSKRWLEQDAVGFSERIIRAAEPFQRNETFRDSFLPLLASLDGYYGELEYNTEEQWPLRHTSSEIIISGLPATYAELLDYATKLWPPCMQAMIQRTAALPYHVRLALSALIRVFGYTLDQGEHLWVLIFSAWDSQAAGNPSLFLKSDRGRVLRADYENGKTTNMGVGCIYLSSCDLCPFKSMDIEECQTQCSGGLPYRISSPRNYFKLASRQNKEPLLYAF